MLCHRTIVQIRQRKEHHHDQRQDRIEIERDRLDKQIQTVSILHIRGNRCRPGRNRSDDTDRCSRRVDQICQLRTRNLALVAHGTHHAAHRQTVEIIINEDQNAERDRRNLSACARLDMRGCPTAKRRRTARLIHQHHHDAQNHKEYQNADVRRLCHRRHNALVKDMQQRPLEIKSRVQKPAHQNAHKERGVNFLGDQSQRDRNDRGKQGPEGLVKVGSGFRCAAFRSKGSQGKK